MAHPWLEILAVLITGIVLLTALGVYQSYKPTHPELIRKLLHVGVGLIALSFPWLFSSAWPVFVVVALAALFIWIVRATGRRLSLLGSVLSNVHRQSRGERHDGRASG